VDKMRENRLGRFGHVMRMENSEGARTDMEINVERSRGRRGGWMRDEDRWCVSGRCGRSCQMVDTGGRPQIAETEAREK